MGLFNAGKNEKIMKVEKYEQNNPVSPSKGHNRPSKSHKHSSKHQQHNVPENVRRNPKYGNHVPGSMGYHKSPNGNNFQIKYVYPSNSPYELNKYIRPSLPINSFPVGQLMPPRNFVFPWSNRIPQFNDQSPFQQQLPLNIYQQNAWPNAPPSNYGYFQPMNY